MGRRKPVDFLPIQDRAGFFDDAEVLRALGPETESRRVRESKQSRKVGSKVSRVAWMPSRYSGIERTGLVGKVDMGGEFSEEARSAVGGRVKVKQEV